MKKLNYTEAKKYYSDEEIYGFVKKNKDKIKLYNHEGFGTFAKSTAEATGIPNVGRNLLSSTGGLLQKATQGFADKQATGTADLGRQIQEAKRNGDTELYHQLLAESKDRYNKNSNQMGVQSYNEKLANQNLSLREQAGTTGSFVKDGKFNLNADGFKTIGRGLLDGAKAVGTVAGLAVNPLAVAKTAMVMSPVGGAISKLTGGTFSEGAGSGLGSSGYLTTLNGILQIAKIGRADKLNKQKIKKFNSTTKTVKEKVWKKTTNILDKPEYKDLKVNKTSVFKKMKKIIKKSSSDQPDIDEAIKLANGESQKGMETLLNAFQKGRNYSFSAKPKNGLELFRNAWKSQFNQEAVNLVAGRSTTDGAKLISILNQYKNISRIQSNLHQIGKAIPTTLAHIGLYQLLSNMNKR